MKYRDLFAHLIKPVFIEIRSGGVRGVDNVAMDVGKAGQWAYNHDYMPFGLL